MSSYSCASQLTPRVGCVQPVACVVASVDRVAAESITSSRKKERRQPPPLASGFSQEVHRECKSTRPIFYATYHVQYTTRKIISVQY